GQRCAARLIDADDDSLDRALDPPGRHGASLAPARESRRGRCYGCRKLILTAEAAEITKSASACALLLYRLRKGGRPVRFAAALPARRPARVRRREAGPERRTGGPSIGPLTSGPTKRGAPSWFSPATVTASTATASTVPQTLTRPGRIEVAPSRAAVKAGSRYSWPTELWPIWSCDCSTMPAKEASVP